MSWLNSRSSDPFTPRFSQDLTSIGLAVLRRRFLKMEGRCTMVVQARPWTNDRACLYYKLINKPEGLGVLKLECLIKASYTLCSAKHKTEEEIR